MKGDDAAVTSVPKWLPATVARGLGWQRALRGQYDAKTEALFRQAGERGGSRRQLLDWLRFRRELGVAVGVEQAERLKRLNAGREDALAWRALELIVETDSAALAQWDGPLAWLLRYAERSPPIAAALARTDVVLDSRAARLAELCEQQAAWRSDLHAMLAQTRGGICVVGNAGHLAGAGLGSRIDEHDCVVRFNHWRSEGSRMEDLGTRLDVWVCNPTFIPQALGKGFPLPHWVVLAGPDALYNRAGRGEDWDAMLKLRDAGVRVLTFPLGVWGELVGELGAPPSAGLMFLAWTRQLLDGWHAITATGFGGLERQGPHYHHAGRRMRPGRRHRWDREAALLARWKTQGLRSL